MKNRDHIELGLLEHFGELGQQSRALLLLRRLLERPNTEKRRTQVTASGPVSRGVIIPLHQGRRQSESTHFG